MTPLQGTHVVIGVINDDTGNITTIGLVKKNSLKVQRNMIKIASPNSGDAEEFIPGRYSWEMSAGRMVSNDERYLRALFANKSKIHLSMRDITDGSYSHYHSHGYVYIKSISESHNIHEMSQMDVTFQGTGTLSYSKFGSNDIDLYVTTKTYTAGRFEYYTYEMNLLLPSPINFNVGYDIGSSYISFSKGDTFKSVTVVAEHAQFPYIQSQSSSYYRINIINSNS